jgi:hypothetical protein
MGGCDHDWCLINTTIHARDGSVTYDYRCSKCGDTKSETEK